MFSALRQGSTVYILEKGDKITCKPVQVTSVSSPQFNPSNYANGNFGGTINISVDDNGKTRDFGGLPSNQSIVQYNNGTVIVSESREAVMTEVDNMIRNSQSILDNIDYHKRVITDGEQILASLNPQFAKDKARDEEIKNLHGRVDGIDGKLDKLISMLSAGK